MSKKPATPFQRAYCLQFELKIVEEANKRITSVRCNFCTFFGRVKVKVSDEHVGKKRQRSSRNDTKYWTSFVPQNYRNHHESQHTDLSAEYSALSKEEKHMHFNGKVNRANTLHRYVDLESDSLMFHVSTPIIDVIIVDLFFWPDEVLINFDDDEDEDDGNAVGVIAKKATAKAKQKNSSIEVVRQGHGEHRGRQVCGHHQGHNAMRTGHGPCFDGNVVPPGGGRNTAYQRALQPV